MMSNPEVNHILKTPLLEGSGRASSDPTRSTTKKPVEMTEMVAEDPDTCTGSYEGKRQKKKKKGVTWSGNINYIPLYTYIDHGTNHL